MPNQALNLFKKECALLKVKFDESAAKKVSNLGLLAPGDFASVRRQAKFRPIKNGDDFYERLEQEVTLKNEEKSARIGFWPILNQVVSLAYSAKCPFMRISTKPY